MATGLHARRQAFARDPDDGNAFEALEEHYFIEGDWQALAALYRARLAAPSVSEDISRQGPLLFRLGQIYEERLLDLEAASETYWKLARLDPAHRHALRQLRGLHERAAQWDLVLQLAEIESQREMPPFERAAFEAELGRIWGRELGDAEEARQAFDRSLAADPTHPAALEGLAALHRGEGRPEAAAPLLERLTDRLRGPERAPVWVALGTLYAAALENPERAALCFERALEDDPFSTAAVEWALLLATAAERWPEVAELLEKRFDLAAGARHRAAIAVEAGELQRVQLASLAGARAWLDRATELAPDEPAVLMARADLERAEGDPDALLATLDRLIEVAEARVPRSALLEAAHLHARFDQPEAALEALARARCRPGPSGSDVEGFALHADLLRRTAAPTELAELLETWTVLDEADAEPVRAARLRELARLYEEDLDDSVGAEATWQRAFDLDPAHPEACQALERIHRKSQDWSALRGVFETALARDPSCLPALAGLRGLAEHSADPDLLLDLCEREASIGVDEERMAEIVQTAVPILVDRDRLEDAFDWATRWLRQSPRESRAYDLHAGLAQRLARGEDELRSRRALARLQSGLPKAQSLQQVARLQYEHGDPEGAVASLEDAAAASPDDLEIREMLCDAYRGLERPRELAQALRHRADRLPPEARADVLDELARLLEGPLGDLDTAIVVRWRLAELPEAPQDAQQALETLLENAGRYAELVQLLDERRERLADLSPDAFEIDRRRARLRLDALGQSEEAAKILSILHTRHPTDEGLLNDLERALRSSDDSRGLCELLERRAGRETDGARRDALDFERASLLEESLDETHTACDLLEAIARRAALPQHAREARDRLEGLLESSEQWPRLRTHLLRRVEAEPESRRAAIHERIAHLCADRLHDTRGCAEQYEAIVRLDPGCVHAWQELGALYAGELDRPADWLRVVDAELAHQPTPDREISLRVGVARMLLDEERRPEHCEAATAFIHFARVLELAPGHAEAAEILAAHYEATGRPAEAVRVLEQRLAHLDESRSRSPEPDETRLQLARLYAEALDDPLRARALLEDLRRSLGPSEGIDESLARIHLRTGDDLALSSLCREALEGEPAAPGALRWRIRLGASAQRLGHLDDAAIAYRAALIDSPDDREIEDALIEIYRALGESDPLIELLEKRLPYVSADEAITIRLELATWHAGPRGEPREALAQLERILAIHPQHRDALDRALALGEAAGKPEKLLEILDSALATPLPNAERARLQERRGHLLAACDGQLERALPCFREALALEPSRTSAQGALRVVLERLERWPAVLDCLFLEASNAGDLRRIEVFEEALEIAWARLGPDAALPWILRLRAERPEDPALLGRMAEAHRRAGRFEATLRAMDEELRLHDDREERCRILLERAQLLERDLNAPGRAVLTYQALLELDATHDVALAELDRLYEVMQRPFERAAILERRIRRHSDADTEAYALRETLGALYCTDLAAPLKAVPHLLRNVDAMRDEPARQSSPLAALDAALRASARFDAWVRVAERELELIETHQEVADAVSPHFGRSLRQELARVYDEELGDPDRALAHLRLLGEGEDRLAVPIRVWERDLLRRTGRRLELAASLTAELAQREGDAQEWLELGRLREDVLIDSEGALEAYRRAWEGDASCLAAVRGLRRCSERLRDWPGVADALEQELASGDTLGLAPAERAAIARCLGQVCEQRLAAGQRASEAYARSLELEPAQLDLLHSLALLCETLGEIDRSIALHESHLALLVDANDGTDDRTRPRARPSNEDGYRDGDVDDRRRAIWLRIASLQRDRGHEAEAVEAYQAAHAIERLSAPDELCLARLHESRGDHESHARLFGAWCDRMDSGATAGDEVDLARRLLARGAIAAARDRLLRATAKGAQEPKLWLLLAELERDAGDVEAALAAFEKAASVSDPESAARHRIAAAALLGDADLERAHGLLARAVSDAPASVEAGVELVRAAARLGRHEQTALEAERALTLDEARAPAERIADGVRSEISLLGGRAARGLGCREQARRLFGIVLALDPEAIEALEGLAELDFEDGDHHAAQLLLERRLEQPGDNPARATQLAMSARGLENEPPLDAAANRYREALELAPELSMAHEGLVRVLERAAMTEAALEALEDWVEAETEPEQRARVALHAAEIAWAKGDTLRASRHLETATGCDPRLTPAWLLRSELAAAHGDEHETRRICEAALEASLPDAHSARIALLLARLEEAGGDRNAARARYAEASRWDRRGVEAVLCESRLARQAGDWSAADAALARFVEAHPDPASASLAVVLLERGHLLAGPLEDLEGAIHAYEQALDRQPGLSPARSALAGLLLHAPDRAAQALTLHRSILEDFPASASSHRAVAEVARRAGRHDVREGALALLDALGLASPFERGDVPRRLPFAIRTDPPLQDTGSQRLRRLARLLREEIDAVLKDVDATPPDSSHSTAREAARQILELEADDAAPRISLISAEARAELFSSIAALCSDGSKSPDELEGSRRRALDQVFSRRMRRKARRLVEHSTLSAIDEIDQTAWAEELRADAAARLVDQRGGDLRGVLLGLLLLDRKSLGSAGIDEGDLSELIESVGPARRLLTRISHQLCQRLESPQ